MNFRGSKALIALLLICFQTSYLVPQKKNGVLATHSLFSAEEALYLNFPDKDSFKKTVIGKIVLAIYRATLNDPHASTRESAAKSLKELTRILNGDLVLLNRYWLSLYRSAQQDAESRVRSAAAEVLFVLGETLSDNKEGLREFWLPLFLENLEEPDVHMIRVCAKNFQLFIRHFADEKELMAAVWFPFFRQNITALDEKTKRYLWEGAVLLAQIYSREPEYIKEKVFPFLEKKITSDDFLERGIAVQCLGPFAYALPKNHFSILELWLPLYKKALEKEPLKAARALGGLTEAFSGELPLIGEYVLPLIDKALENPDRRIQEGAAASLGQIALAFKGQPAFIQEEVIPLFEKALRSEKGDTRKQAVTGLENLVESIIETPSPFTRTLFSFYKQGIEDSHFQTPKETILQFPALARLLSIDSSIPVEEWLPLFSNSFEMRGKDCELKLAESITPLALALAHDPDALETKWFPLFERACTHPNPQVRSKVSNSLGRLALHFKEDPVYLKEKILPFYEKALSHSDERIRIAAAASLEGLAEAFNGSIALINENWFNYFNKVNYDPDKQVSRVAAASIGGLAKSLSGNTQALEEVVIPLFKRGIHHPDEAFRRILTGSLGTLALSFKGNLKSIREDLFPLYTHALNDNNFAVRIELAKSLASLAEATFPNIDGISPAESTLIAEYFLASETLNQDSSLATLLGILLLIRGYPKSLPHSTHTWECVINLLPVIKKEPPEKLAYFSFLSQQALGRKAKNIDREIIKEAYKEYFHTPVLPKRRTGPKHLLALMLLDYELKKWGLPTVYSNQLRQFRRGTAYTELLPIIERLSRPHDDLMREAVEGFTQWGENLPPKDVKPFWGTVQRLFEQVARNNESYQSLGIQNDVDKLLNLYKEPADDKLRALQRALAKLESLIPQRAAQLFGIELKEKKGKKKNGVSFDQRELNVLHLVAKIPEYRQPQNSLHQELKKYFSARLNGMTRAEASEKFAVNNQLRMTAPPISGKVFLKRTNQAKEYRVGQWKDAIRHLKQLSLISTNTKLKRKLRPLLAGIPEELSTDQAEYYLKLLLELTGEFESSISIGSRPLWKTIKTHLKNVQGALPKERKYDEAPQEFDPSLVPFREVEIYHSTDPVEILNLGWPYLGSSCLDIVRGSFLMFAAGYLLHHHVMILYIQDPKKKDKPLARVSVGIGGSKEHPVFFLLSPIKANIPYDFRPLLERYLLTLASNYGGEAFLPLDLYREPSKTFKTEMVQRKIYFSPGRAPFYSDLTDEITSMWAGEVDGFLLTSREEEVPAIEEAI